MTSVSQPTDNDRTVTILAFVFSLIIGLSGGAILIALVWLGVLNTAVGPRLALALGITAQTPWFFTRSAGTVAYLLLAGSTIWGMLLSTKIIKEMVPAAIALAMHNILSWLAIALTGLHALALLFDNYYTYTAVDLAVPFVGPYKPGWVGLGILGLYIMLITSISFYFRKQLGQKRWRQLHYLTFGAFLLATIHGVMAGTDSANTGMMAMYYGSTLAVLFLSNYRLLVARHSSRRENP